MTVLKRVHIKYITLLKDVVRCPWSNASRHIPLKNLLGGGVVTKCSGDPSDTLLLHGLITPPSLRLFDKSLLHKGGDQFNMCFHYELCVLDVSPGVLLCSKNLKEESKFPDVAQFSLTSTAASKNRKVSNKPATAIWLQLVFRPFEIL